MTLTTKTGIEIHASLIVLTEKSATMMFQTDSLNMKEAVYMFEDGDALPIQGYEKYTEFNGARKGINNNIAITLSVPVKMEVK